MPKEWSHWLLAEKTALRLPDGVLKNAVETYHDLFLFGAVAHDSPYYLPDGNPLQGISDRLHGRFGYDTFRPYRILSPKVFEAEGMGTELFRCSDAPLAALLAGSLCHIAADTVFHPWVFSCTGADGAFEEEKGRWKFRHRAFETALDEYLVSVWGKAAGGRSVPELTGSPDTARAAGRFWNEVLPCPQETARAILVRHGNIQKLFVSKGARMLASLQGRLKGSGTSGDFTSTFYGYRTARNFSLNEKLEFRHPLSGVPVSTTLGDLAEQAQVRGLEWLALLERGGRSADGSGFPDPPLSLDTGLPVTSGDRMRWFSPGFREG